MRWSTSPRPTWRQLPPNRKAPGSDAEWTLLLREYPVTMRRPVVVFDDGRVGGLQRQRVQGAVRRRHVSDGPELARSRSPGVRSPRTMPVVSDRGGGSNQPGSACDWPALRAGRKPVGHPRRGDGELVLLGHTTSCRPPARRLGTAIRSSLRSCEACSRPRRRGHEGQRRRVRGRALSVRRRASAACGHARAAADLGRGGRCRRRAQGRRGVACARGQRIDWCITGEPSSKAVLATCCASAGAARCRRRSPCAASVGTSPTRRRRATRSTVRCRCWRNSRPVAGTRLRSASRRPAADQQHQCRHRRQQRDPG